MAGDALDILQTWLDRMADAIMSNDLDTTLAHFDLPVTRVLLDSWHVTQTRAEVARELNNLNEGLLSQGVNQLIRLGRDAEFLEEDFLEGSYITHMLRNAVPVIPSFKSRVMLRRSDGVWRLVEAQNGYAGHRWPMPFTETEETENDADVAAAQPMAIFQSFLNKITEANRRGDVEGFCKHMCFPLGLHAQEENQVANGPDDLRPLLERLERLISQAGVDRFERRANRAEFLSRDLICGHQSSHFLRNGRPVAPSVTSRIILRRTASRWRMQSITNSILNFATLYRVPADDTVAREDI